MNNVKQYVEALTLTLVRGLPNLFFAIITLLAGFWIIKRFVRFLHARLHRNSIDVSLSEFLISIVNVVLYVLLIISCASMIGIQTSSFVAVLGAAGLAVGLALQGSLSNFAGGVLILLFKPFKVGHNITSSNNVAGTVLKIDILYTTLKAGNGTTIYAPNGPLANAVINNASDNDIRQAEYKISISFDNNIEAVRKVLLAILENDPLTLQDPKPAVLVSSIGDDAIILIIRSWSLNADFWTAYYSNYQKLKEELEVNKIKLPSTTTVVNVNTNPLP
ncbi:mechanosensitive ion channel family protein [Pedobacter sp. L105]|uniref:mechanosensitive ion channel family protein n=1 Tax=Pedobacter sp. L105 TaxID=1641871 RepID=UPI00131C9FAF|nr:mechanosensitive ion channel domain-containing protein [Pedobacter sp. L105]